MNRYLRNIGTIGEEGQRILNNKKVLIIGLGGLGGFVVEGLARMGIKTIGICDYDSFDESNLNRQLLSQENTIGKKKVITAYERIKNIDSTIEIKKYEKAFPSKQIIDDIKNYDLIVDCLDSIKTRIQLENISLYYNKKIIYGAVGGYYGSIGVICKENNLMEKMKFKDNEENNFIEKEMGNPFSIVGVVSSLQVQLAIMVLLDKPYLKEGMYYIDIENFSIEEIKF